jgi:hypothetical protein
MPFDKEEWVQGDYDDFLGMGPDEVAVVEARGFADEHGPVMSRRGWTNAQVKAFFREALPRFLDEYHRGLRPRC